MKNITILLLLLLVSCSSKKNRTCIDENPNNWEDSHILVASHSNKDTLLKDRKPLKVYPSIKRAFDNLLTSDEWYLQSVYGKPINSLRIGRLKSAFINFENDGLVSGQTRCNNFNGRFDVDSIGYVTVSDLVVTKMVCPKTEMEQEYMDVLSQEFRYSIVQDTLEFINVDDVVIAKFVQY